MTPIVVAELAYVSRSLSGWTRRVAAQRLGSLLQAEGLIVIERDTMLRALGLYGERSNLDFADAYLAAIALEKRPPIMASFDSDLDGIDGIRRLSA